jgi:hypothetical protein
MTAGKEPGNRCVGPGAASRWRKNSPLVQRARQGSLACNALALEPLHLQRQPVCRPLGPFLPHQASPTCVRPSRGSPTPVTTQHDPTRLGGRQRGPGALAGQLPLLLRHGTACRVRWTVRGVGVASRQGSNTASPSTVGPYRPTMVFALPAPKPSPVRPRPTTAPSAIPSLPLSLRTVPTIPSKRPARSVSARQDVSLCRLPPPVRPLTSLR